eukprot:3975718-Pyramimonas_sp.AAC.2
MDLIVVKLQLLLETAPAGGTSVQTVDTDESIVPLLRSLTLAVDRNSHYHQKHKDSPLPFEDPSVINMGFA